MYTAPPAKGHIAGQEGIGQASYHVVTSITYPNCESTRSTFTENEYSAAGTRDSAIFGFLFGMPDQGGLPQVYNAQGRGVYDNPYALANAEFQSNSTSCGGRGMGKANNTPTLVDPSDWNGALTAIGSALAGITD